MKDPTPQSSTR